MDTRDIQTGLANGAKRGLCRLLADVRRHFQVPQFIVVTVMRPYMVLYSECERIVYFIELTIPFEDVIEEAFECLTPLLSLSEVSGA